MIGQLYVVATRAELPCGDILKERWIVNGSSEDDVIMKLRWHIDASQFKCFSVKSIEKVKPGFHKISSSLTAPDTTPKFVDKDGEAHVQRTNQPGDKGVFAVGLACTVGAVDDAHAMRLAGQFLIDSGTGRENKRVNESRVVMVEELGESDSTNVSKWENVFKATHIFRGGAIGMGR